MNMVKLPPVVLFSDRLLTLSKVKVKVESCIFQMSLNKDQTHPAKKTPRPVLFELLVQRAGSLRKHGTDGFLELFPHKRVASSATKVS